jgi:acetate kinase
LDDRAQGPYIAAFDAARVLVLNSGSSSIKYQLIDMAGRTRLATGLVERIGESGAGRLSHHAGDGAPHEIEREFPDHGSSMDAILAAFSGAGPELTPGSLTAVGHRVVHGGDRFAAPVLIDERVLKAIRDLSPLAPLHNPANLALIEVARRAFPDIPHVAVFDTAFHQTLPPHAHTYAVPKAWRQDLGVRRYGFHGTSHQYVARRAAAMLGKTSEQANIIVLHLGNGASATAVAAGRSVDTSMGLTPLEGLVMGTRSGDVDPALPAYLARVAGLGPEAVDAALNNESGLLALAGSNDLRDITAAADAGDEDACLAIDVYCHRILKYVGAYYAVLGRVDAVVFTAGVGENSARIRAMALNGLERLGIRVDPGRNAEKSDAERFISPEGSEVAVLVVPTDEEIEIADQTLGCLTD